MKKSMNTSYLYRLRDEISEMKKNATTQIKEKKIILSSVLPGGVEKRKYIQNVFNDEKWKIVCSNPDIIYVIGNTAHYYFGTPTGSLNNLISVFSSILTRHAHEDCKYVCVCTAAQMTNLPEVFAFFVLESEAYYRKELEKIVGKPVDHLTNKELKTETAPFLEKIKQKKRASGTIFRKNEPEFDMVLTLVEYDRQAPLLFGDVKEI